MHQEHENAALKELVPRVDNLIKGGVIPKPLWYDAVLAHPPTLEHKVQGIKPQRFLVEKWTCAQN